MLGVGGYAVPELPPEATPFDGKRMFRDGFKSLIRLVR